MEECIWYGRWNDSFWRCPASNIRNLHICYFTQQKWILKIWLTGVPIVPQQKQIQLGTTGLRVRSLASLRGLGSSVAVSCSAGQRCGLDLALLWICHRPAAVAPIWHLAWRLPYATGKALKSKKKDCGLFNRKFKRLQVIVIYVYGNIYGNMFLSYSLLDFS